MTSNGRLMDRDVPPGTTQMKDSDVPRHRTAAVGMPIDRAVEAAPPNSRPCRPGDHNHSDIVDQSTVRRCCASAGRWLERRSNALTWADNRADHRRDAIASKGTDGLDGVEQAREANAVGVVRRDDGVATVFACLALAALIGATLLIAQVGAVVVARHRAQAAADLAALAAAGELARGADVGCAEAGEIARRIGARIQRCEVVQWDATVTVEGNVPMGLLGTRTVRAVARAGPVEVET
ncbi:Rv3654c family TadE-like protein [Nocardia sp. CA-135953]|uniref:Rv3654c family TadE-like protein n=1 Tax=Nocardia sp. CA-135953 TaxID=3239978 RepID=UPI003D9598CC